jgi:hypothetical protein
LLLLLLFLFLLLWMPLVLLLLLLLLILLRRLFLGKPCLKILGVLFLLVLQGGDRTDRTWWRLIPKTMKRHERGRWHQLKSSSVPNRIRPLARFAHDLG